MVIYKKIKPHSSSFYIYSVTGLIILVYGSLIFYMPSDDVSRYLWEGMIASKGYNPYLKAPITFVANSISEFPYYSTINHKDKTTIYGAVYLLIMRVIYFLSGEKSYLIVYKVFICLLSLGILRILFLLLKKNKKDPNVTFLIALNPLWLFFVIGEGHIDVVQIFFLLLAFLYKDKKSPMMMLIFYLASLQIKITSILFFPLFLKKHPLKLMFLTLLSLLLYAPYYQRGEPTLLNSLITFGTEMSYNSFFHTLGIKLFNTPLMMRSVFIIIYGYFLLFSANLIRTCFLFYLLFLLFSPIIHPWYLGMLLILNAFFKTRSIFLWTFCFIFSFPLYHRFYTSGLWQEYPLAKYFIYLPFLGCLFVEWYQNKLFGFSRKKIKDPLITIIIPTLNEEKTISNCIKAIKQNNSKIPFEIIISDGGSEDKTIALGKQHGARVITSQKGRGYQIEAGYLQAKGNLICVLHSDVMIYKDTLGRMKKTFLQNPNILMLSFSMQYREEKQMKRISKLNNLRVFLTQISFGDQIQCFKKEALEATGGFPKIKLFEDVEVCLQIKASGRITSLKNGGVISMRKWKQGPKWFNVVKVISLFLSYFIFRFFSPKKGGEILYKLYYK